MNQDLITTYQDLKETPGTQVCRANLDQRDGPERMESLETRVPMGGEGRSVPRVHRDLKEPQAARATLELQVHRVQEESEDSLDP